MSCCDVSNEYEIKEMRRSGSNDGGTFYLKRPRPNYSYTGSNKRGVEGDRVSDITSLTLRSYFVTGAENSTATSALDGVSHTERIKIDNY
jgi:hypothetical protein